eukprot:6174238-Pleurochrysis_carterae.AAC.3
MHAAPTNPKRGHAPPPPPGPPRQTHESARGHALSYSCQPRLHARERRSFDAFLASSYCLIGIEKFMSVKMASSSIQSIHSIPCVTCAHARRHIPPL